MNAHKQLDTTRLLERRDIVVAPFVSEPRDFMPAQSAPNFDAMRDRDRFAPSRTRHDLSVEHEYTDTLGAGELGAMERAVRDHYDTYDGGASRHSFGGTVAAPSGGTLATTQGAVGVTRYGDAELSVARPTVRYAKTMSRDAAVKPAASRQYAYEPTQRVADRVERAVHAAPECNKIQPAPLSPRAHAARAALATLRAMHGCATRVVARHVRTAFPASDARVDGPYVACAGLSSARADDATIVSDRRDRSTTVRAPMCDATSARQGDWRLEHRADREQVREAATLGEMHSLRQQHSVGNDRETRVAWHEAPQFGEMHSLRQQHSVGNDRETRVVVHEAPQFGAMHSLRQQHSVGNDRETRVVVHEAPQFGAMHIVRQPQRIGNERETRVVAHAAPPVGCVEAARLHRPRLPLMSDRAALTHRASELNVHTTRSEPSLLAPRNERVGGPERRGIFGHAPTKRLVGVRLEGGNASAASVIQANLGAVATRADLVARDVDASTAVSSHLAPSQHPQHQPPKREPSRAATRYDLEAPEYAVRSDWAPQHSRGAELGAECARETLRLEPHHAAVAIAPPVAHCVRGRGRQEYEERYGSPIESGAC
jgi:hypothetical protein